MNNLEVTGLRGKVIVTMYIVILSSLYLSFCAGIMKVPVIPQSHLLNFVLNQPFIPGGACMESS